MKSGVFFLMVLLGHGGVGAGDFQQAYEAALLNDATYRAARAEFASAQQNAPMAFSGLLPNVSLSLSDSQVNGSRTQDNSLGQPVASPLDYRAPVQSLNIRAPLFNREATQKYQLAQAQVEYAKAIFVTRTADLLDRLATAYLQRWLAENAVLTAGVQVQASQAQSDLAHRRFQLGEGTRPEVAEADAALDMAHVLLLEAQDQRSLATLALGHISGSDHALRKTMAEDAASVILLTAFPKVNAPLAELIIQADASNPNIAARRHAVLLAQLAVARNESGHYPRLDLVASASSSRNESLSSLNQSAEQRSVGLQLNLPLYSGGYVRASVAQALADQDKAEAELVAEQQMVARELTKLYFSVTHGPNKLQSMQKAVESAKLMLDGAHKGSLTGFNTQIDVALGQRKLAQAQHDLAQSIQEHLLAHMQLLAQIGAEPAQALAHMDALLN